MQNTAQENKKLKTTKYPPLGTRMACHGQRVPGGVPLPRCGGGVKKSRAFKFYNITQRKRQVRGKAGPFLGRRVLQKYGCQSGGNKACYETVSQVGAAKASACTSFKNLPR